MHALVTGSKGFVGRRLIPRLRAEGWAVTGHDMELDVVDPAVIEAAFERLNPDAVVHLAAQSSVAVSLANPALTHRVNYLGTLSILKAALGRAVRPRVLLIGSSEQYGLANPGAPPFTEESPMRPRSAYARSKAEADRLAARFRAAGLPVVCTRSFNHSGAGQSDTFVLSSFARQIAEIELGRREPVMRVGNLDSVRDFLDVDDVIEAYVQLLDPAVPADVYNVASGVGVRIGELLDQLRAAARVQPVIERDPARFRPTDFSVGDASRLRTATGWEPRVPLERSLESLLDYWRDTLSAS